MDCHDKLISAVQCKGWFVAGRVHQASCTDNKHFLLKYNNNFNDDDIIAEVL